MIRRINIFGGPGCGKSTAAASLFGKLKSENYEIELIDEYVKSWAYEGRKICSFDQAYLFMQQLRREYLVLRNSTGMVITDSPIVMTICYAKKYHFKRCKSLQDIADDFEKEYPSINIILDRKNCKYKHTGRYENYQQAIEMDKLIMNYINKLSLKRIIAPYNNYILIYKWIMEEINGNRE